MRPRSGGALVLSSVVALTCLTGLDPSYAAVGMVSASGSVVSVIGTDGQDFIRVETAALATHVEVDTNPEFAAGPGCTLDDDPSTDMVICELGSAGRVEIDAGSADDGVWVTDSSPNTHFVITLGPGRDFGNGGPAIEEWHGGDGDDRLTPDALFGRTRPAIPGPDVVRGGGGQDQVNMGGHRGVSVTLDDKPNDTMEDVPGFDDIGSDVEILVGSEVDDSLTGNDGAQVFDGGPGNDTIVALSGDDVVGGNDGSDLIEGGPGHDRLFGSAGDDRVVGGVGDDGLFGESGNDTLVGGPGVDSMVGDSGDPLVTGADTIAAVDGERDAVSCGPGDDAAQVDNIDTVSAGGQDSCETLGIIPAPPPAAAPPVSTSAPGPGSGSVATLRGSVLRVNRRGTSTEVPVRCSGASAACTGRVVVRKRRAILAEQRYTVSTGSLKRVALRLTRRGRAVVTRRSSVRVVVALVAADGSVSRRRYDLERR